MTRKMSILLAMSIIVILVGFIAVIEECFYTAKKTIKYFWKDTKALMKHIWEKE